MGNVTSATHAASLSHVSMRFGAVVALRDVDVQVAGGTIHAFVGANGAGKSTALGLLAGRFVPTSGQVELFGSAAHAGHPRAVRRAGVATIYQELTIVPDLGAEANVFLGNPSAKGGFLARRAMRSAYEEMCARFGVPPVPPGVTAGRLSLAQQQQLEIMRALVGDVKLILLDEPTASLGMSERRALLESMKRFRAGGITMVFVAHSLSEVLEVSDVITVFEGGRAVKTAPRAEWTRGSLIAGIVGGRKHAKRLGPQRARPGRARRADSHGYRLEAVVSVPGAITDVDVRIRAGEILGIGGLVGSGRTSLLRALAGLEPHAHGRMWLDGQEVPWPRSVRRALNYGIALLPEDRRHQGLVLDLPGDTNVVMSDFGAAARWGILSRTGLENIAKSAVEPFSFDDRRLREPVSNLSGGNQQKLLLGRWSHRAPRILLADEPTRGIDVGAKEDVMAALERMAEGGLSIVFVSSELEEVASLSQRTMVLAEGRNAGLLEDPSDISVSTILQMALAGARSQEEE